MIESIVFAALMLTAGGIILWLSHWLRRHIEVRYRRPCAPLPPRHLLAAKLDAEFDDINTALDLAFLGPKRD